MKKVLVDFDNTINVRDCDIDDAFALFFLLSHKGVEVVGITTTFGNSNEDDTYNSTVMMNSDLGIDIPLKKGGIYSYDAAKFIKETVESENVSLISLGSTTNTTKALALGMDTKNLTEFVQMNGYGRAQHVHRLSRNQLRLRENRKPCNNNRKQLHRKEV